MNLSELIAAYGEQALDKAAREGYAVRCKTHGPRVLAQYATADIMKMQLDDARVIVSAYLDALSVPAAAVVGEPVAWRYKLENWGPEYWQYFTKEPRHKEPGEVWQPLYAAPSAPDGWRPIASAPRDGSKVDLWGINHLHYAKEGKRAVNVAWGPVRDWMGTERDDWQHGFGEDFEPTHWKPLPAPPALGGASHE